MLNKDQIIWIIERQFFLESFLKMAKFPPFSLNIYFNEISFFQIKSIGVTSKKILNKNFQTDLQSNLCTTATLGA
jgi:hypothetical protein